MTTFITGGAGFIGAHLARRLTADGETVVTLDDHNDYYAPSLKADRLTWAQLDHSFEHYRGSLEDEALLKQIFETHRPSRVVNLAAEAGVRGFEARIRRYLESNLVGFGLLLEACRRFEVEHLVYASTSSAYGLNRSLPYAEDQPVAHPASFYGATKLANEDMAHSYSHMFGLPATGLRFFTVYGPWDRPDMALQLFTKAIIEGEPVKVFNDGKLKRDWTYIDDIVEGIVRVLRAPPTPNESWQSDPPTLGASSAPHRVFNIGAGQSVPLLHFIEVLEQALGRKANKEFLPMQPGDVLATHADVSALDAAVGYRPQVSVEEGVPRFVEWYRDYHQV